MQEEWKDIIGYDGLYKISNYGDVKSFKNNREIILSKITREKKGYGVSLSKKSIIKTFYVHRLVATYFVNNPFEYNIIKHIDGDNKNNVYTNLKWCETVESKGMTGKKHSPWAKIKMRRKRIGFKHTEETKRIMAFNSTGRTHKAPEITRTLAKGLSKIRWEQQKQKQKNNIPKLSKEYIANVKEFRIGAIFYNKKTIDKKRKKKLVEKKGRFGENHWNWKGGRSRGYKEGYYSSEYKNWRSEVFKRDNYTCKKCKKTNLYITAHHIKSWAKFPELRFDVNNGITLCEKCHKLTDNYKGRNLSKKII